MTVKYSEYTQDLLQKSNHVTQLDQCEIMDDHKDTHTIRDLIMKKGYTLRSTTIDGSTTVDCYSACMSSANGQLINKESHVAFLMDDKVCLHIFSIMYTTTTSYNYILRLSMAS